jgi:ferric-dicitrate binding protein FerR (iron transport regulator)
VPLVAAAVVFAAAFLAVQSISRRAPQPAPAREVVTRAGERAQLRLADGTSIVLGPATTLRIPATFGVTARTVDLHGRAYFEVAHDPAHPFTVLAGHTRARALGTRFSVRAYPTDSVIEVVVADGVVGLGSDSAGLRLHPGDMGRVDRAGRSTMERVQSVNAALAWTTGVLQFDDVALRDAIPDLQRQYGLVVRVTGAALFARRFTATFTDRNVGEALDGLAFLLGAHYARAGDTVTFVGGK